MMTDLVLNPDSTKEIATLAKGAAFTQCDSHVQHEDHLFKANVASINLLI